MTKERKVFVSLLLSVMMIFSTVASTEIPTATAAENTDVTENIISQNEATLGFAAAQTVSISGVTSGSSVSAVWVSDDENVAYVSEIEPGTARIRGVNAGVTNIKAQLYKDGVMIGEQTCSVTVGEKHGVSYSKMKSKTKAKKNKKLQFKKESGSKCSLTMFGLYRLWTIPASWEAGLETVNLYPRIVTWKDGGSSQVALDLKVSGIIAIRKKYLRKYTQFTFTGGGESFKITGSTKSKSRSFSGSTMRQTLTKGTFRISKDKAPNFARIEKLLRILNSKNAKIKTHDTIHGKNYNFKLTEQERKSLTSVVKKYLSLVAEYGK